MFQASSRGYQQAKEARWAIFLDRMVAKTQLAESMRIAEPEIYPIREGNLEDTNKRMYINEAQVWPGATKKEWLKAVRAFFDLAIRPGRSKPGMVLGIAPEPKDWPLEQYYRIINIVIGNSLHDGPGKAPPFELLEEEDFKQDLSRQGIWATFVEYVAYECLYLNGLAVYIPNNNIEETWSREDPEDPIVSNIEMQDEIAEWAISEMYKMKDEIDAGELDPNQPTRGAGDGRTAKLSS